MSIPVRYEVMPMSELCLADLYNDGNFMFWQPGPCKHFRDAPSMGWHKHTKNRKKHYAMMPHASRDLVRDRSVVRFLRHRARLLPRSGGFYYVWLKIFEPIPKEPWHTFSLGFAHYRHCGETSPMALWNTRDQLPEAVRDMFPAELPHGA